jgi:hypothetical protein
VEAARKLAADDEQDDAVIDLSQPSYYDCVGLGYRLHVMHPPTVNVDRADGLCIVGGAFRETWQHRKVYHVDVITIGDGLDLCVACGISAHRQEIVN